MEFDRKPSGEELKAYYADQYYQTSQGAYQHEYNEEEKLFFANRAATRFHIAENYLNTAGAGTPRTLLDLGSGEGWMMKYFKEKGWAVTGVDYSTDGMEKQNPHLLNDMLQGDIYAIMDHLVEQKKEFDVVALLNVLEHVVSPEELLQQINPLIKKGGMLVVDVPNDFSPLQQKLLERKNIDREFWVKYPDHLSYFSGDSLKAVCKNSGFEPYKLVADFPIDFFLANEASNYIADGTKGKAAHRARLLLENLFSELSVTKTIALYEAMAELGMGRQLTGYFIKP